VTKIAVPIAAENPDEAKKQIKAALAAGAEMLELRSDYLENLSVDMVKELVVEMKKAGREKVPVIVTCRDEKQGGARKYPDRLRTEVLAGALQAGAEFIDFEYEKFRFVENQERLRRAQSQRPSSRLILSAHDFERKFENISKLYRSILTVYPAAIPKLVYTANHINDCFEGFDLLHQTSGERIVFCMGEAGLISRIIAKKLGSLVTFASIDEKTATAPGQLTIEQLKKLYRFDSISSDTELFGVIAEPVGHSLSPAIHNACFAEKNMNKLYLPLLVKGGQSEFDLFLNNVIVRKWLNFRGFSVTIPHKQNALNYVRRKLGFIEPSFDGKLRTVETLAEKIGAVNTLVIKEDGRTAGYNTDYAAALDSITSALKVSRAGLKKLPVAVIGAGGVARAIVAGLSDAGAKIKIYNRTIQKAERLAAEFDCEFAGLDDLQNLDAKLVINCTSIGMHPNVNATLLPQEYLKKGMAVFDTVYNPAETLLLQQAKKKRLKRIDGPSMFINQALAQFKLFTGKNANAKLMRRTVANWQSRKKLV